MSVAWTLPLHGRGSGFEPCWFAQSDRQV